MGVAANTIALYGSSRFCATILVDGSGNGYDLTAVGGGVTYNTDGTLPSAAGTKSFDDFSNGNYLSNTDDVNDDMFLQTDNWSFEAYVKLTDGSGNSCLSQHHGANFEYIGTDGGTTRLRTDWQGVGAVNGLAALTVDQWHHVGFAWNGTNMKYYIDGVLDTTTTSNRAWRDYSTIRIGQHTSNLPWKGQIAQVRYSNIARTSFPTLDPVDPISDLAVDDTHSTSVDFTWTESTDVIPDKIFLYFNTSNSFGTATLSGAVENGAGAGSIGGLTAETEYWFWVTEVDSSCNEGTESNTVTTTTDALTSTNATLPTNLVLQNTGRTTAKLVWTDGAGNSFNEVFRNTVDTQSTSTAVGIVSQATQEFQDTGLVAGTTYYWWIKGRHSDDSVSAAVGSVTGATVGTSGIAGTNVVEQIKDAMETRLSTVLGTSYRELDYKRDIEKNSTKAKTNGYGVLVGEAAPSDDTVNRVFQFDHTYTVVLTDHVVRKRTERDQETAALKLTTAMNSIYKDLQQTRLGLPSVVIQVQHPTIEEREVLEGGSTVVLRASFPVIYRQAFR